MVQPHAFWRSIQNIPLVTKLADAARESTESNPAIDDAAHMLLDQARILEGEGPLDPQAFSRRVAQMRWSHITGQFGSEVKVYSKF